MTQGDGFKDDTCDCGYCQAGYDPMAIAIGKPLPPPAFIQDARTAVEQMCAGLARDSYERRAGAALNAGTTAIETLTAKVIAQQHAIDDLIHLGGYLPESLKVLDKHGLR